MWASGDGGEDDDCNCDGYAASMWTVSINSAINDGQNAHYDESCSSTLASTFSNGAKDPNTGVVRSGEEWSAVVIEGRADSIESARIFKSNVRRELSQKYVVFDTTSWSNKFDEISYKLILNVERIFCKL